MLKLYHFGPAWTLADPSPFCLKVIYWLKLAGIPFEPYAGMQHIRSAPKKKMPYVDDDGTLIGDSTFIIDHLRTKHGDPLGTDASPRDVAQAHAIGKMLEENFYFAMVHVRWLNDENWENYTRPQFFSKMPAPVRWILPKMLRRGVEKSLYGQGMGRHTEAQISELALKDIRSVKDILGDRPFMMGDQVSEIDATVTAFLEGSVVPPHPSPVRDWVAGEASLMSYIARVKSLVDASPEDQAAA